MPIIKSKFKPAWGLSNPHLQTLWATFFRKAPDISLTKKRLELDDGDFLDLVTSGFVNNTTNKPIVIILHGLEGSIESSYAKPLIKSLNDAGYAVCFVHFRGCSDTMNRLPRSYHSGDTDDVASVARYIRREYQKNPFAVIGFSLGGNVVLKWMGEQGDAAPVSTAIAVSVPFQLQDAGDRLEKSFSRVYQKHLLSSCQKKYHEKFNSQNARFSSPLFSIPIEKDSHSSDFDIFKLNTFYTFDDQVTAPLHNFKGADDYYQQCSSRQFLKHIKKPTLVIHSKDDPFMWETTVPEEHELSSQVQLELSDSGGHVGFIGGKHPLNVEYWVDKRVVEWLNAQREKSSN